MLKNLKAFAQKPARVVPTGFNKGSRYEDQAVMIIKSVKNSVCIPKGISQKVMGFNAETDKVSLEVIPHYIDADLTMADLRELNAKLADDIVAANAVMTGEELINSLKEGTIQKLLPEDIKEELINSLATTEEYPIISIVYKKEGDVEITPEQYNELSEEMQNEYTYRKDATVAKLSGIVGKDGSFSAAAAYAELGGTCKAYTSRECTEIVETVNRDVDAYTKQLGFALSEKLDLGGMEVYIAYHNEEFDFVSKSKKGVERKSNKTKDVELDQSSAIDAQDGSDPADPAEPIVNDAPLMGETTQSDEFEI